MMSNVSTYLGIPFHLGTQFGRFYFIILRMIQQDVYSQ